MLRSCVVTVRLEPSEELREDIARQLFLGRATQALFLDALARLDPAAANALHVGNGPRPYAVGASLRPPFSPGEPWRAQLRYSTLTPALSERLPEVLQLLPNPLRLDTLSGSVEAVALTAAEDRDAGQSSYQDILNQRLLDAIPPEPRFAFRFLSPTTFHSAERNQPLPLPGLVFGNLVERWNAFSPLTLNAEARRYAEECLAINQFRLESRMVDLAGGRQVGAVGTVGYRSLRPDPYWLRVLHALADFSFYASVGAKTAMGLGQTRRLSAHGNPLRRGAGSDAPQDRRSPGGDEGERDPGERADGES